MNKVYLLLRDNHQSGPFTIDELIQQQLKATDLIWVEGRSTAWNYPYEMEEFKSIVQPPVERWQPAIPRPATMTEVHEKISVLPASPVLHGNEELEHKAEQIRLRTIHYAQQNELPYFDTPDNPGNGSWAVRENIHFVHHTRRKYVTLPQLIATGLVTILLASAWYGDWSVIKVKPEMVTAAATPVAFSEEKPAVPQPSIVAASADTTVTEFQPAAYAAASSASAQPKPAVNQQSLAVHPVVVDTESVAAIEAEAQHAAKKEATEPVEPKEIRKDPVPIETKPVEAVKKEPVVETTTNKQVEEEPREKKKLGQVIKGIFKKKDKE